MIRILSLLLAFGLLSACADRALDEAPEPIGDFKLGFFVPTTAGELTKGPVSREATKEEWKDAMKVAFEPHFKRFTGDRFFHIGGIVEGYVLAQPGIPIVLSPKSALIFRVTVIEDATGITYPEGEAHQITVLESVSAGSIIGSGLTSSKEQQMANLAANAAKATERWMRTQPWFYPDGVLPEDAVGTPEEAIADAQDPDGLLASVADAETVDEIALDDATDSAVEDAVDDPDANAVETLDTDASADVVEEAATDVAEDTPAE